jgi:hypothetical protein
MSKPWVFDPRSWTDGLIARLNTIADEALSSNGMASPDNTTSPNVVIDAEAADAVNIAAGKEDIASHAIRSSMPWTRCPTRTKGVEPTKLYTAC